MIIQISVKDKKKPQKIPNGIQQSKSERGIDHRKGRDGELGKEREGEREGGNRAEEYGTDINDSRIIQPQDE